MKKTISSLMIFLIFAILPSSVHAGESGTRQGRLDQEISTLIDSLCREKEGIGIKIVSLTKQDTLYSRNSQKAFIPASNTKILTSAVALLTLGPEYRFKTLVATDGVISQGVVEGNIYLKGFGDPFLTPEEMWSLVQGVRQRGIRRIQGNLIFDDSYFDGKRSGEGWPITDSTRAYNAPMGALSFNFNTITLNITHGKKAGDNATIHTVPETSFVKIKNALTTSAADKRKNIIITKVQKEKFDEITVSGSIPANAENEVRYVNINRPAEYTAQVFREFLEKEGIKVNGNTLPGQSPHTLTTIHTHESKPLAWIVAGLNKYSNNFMAEQILKTLGAEVKSPPGTAEKGISVIRSTLHDMGVHDDFVMADGSGFSRLNRISPSLIIRILAYMYKNFSAGPEFLSSLSIIGSDGSLRARTSDPSIKRMIRGKTGHLHGVACLSGYAHAKNGETLAFSIFVNSLTCERDSILRLIDSISHTLTHFSREENERKN